jgi:F0F1-type ATP synthase membrane subunit b/b'
MDLERLIVTEQRLDEALRGAREEAARLVAEAQAAAQRAEAELEAELLSSAERLAAETASERERREREVSQEAALTVACYEAVPAERVSAAARDVVERLVAGEAAP